MYEPRQSRAIRALTAGLLLVLASCGVPSEEPRQTVVTGALPSDSLRLFSFTYGQIVDQYVEPVSLSTRIGSGLGNLQKIDPNFAVQRVGDNFEARDHGNLLDSVEAPRTNDSRRWAELTVATINTARATPGPLRQASADTI